LQAALDWSRGHGPLRFLHGVMRRHDRREPTFLWDTGIHLVDALGLVAGRLRELAHQTPSGGCCWRRRNMPARTGW
jgi:hypothetical protein